MKILIVLILIVILKKLKNEGDDETGDDKWLERKIANPLRRAEPIRVMRLAFMVSFATSQGGVKGNKSLSDQFEAATWRFFRQVERCLMIQSVSACSKPMSRPAFSDSIHL
jgi:hypothetical protein